MFILTLTNLATLLPKTQRGSQSADVAFQSASSVVKQYKLRSFADTFSYIFNLIRQKTIRNPDKLLIKKLLKYLPVPVQTIIKKKYYLKTARTPEIICCRL